MKIFIESITNAVIILSLILMLTATLISVGYFLYLWANGTVLSVAMWSGFVLWIKSWLICLVMFFGGAWIKFRKDLK